MTKLTVSMRDQIVGNAIDKAGITKALADLYAERRAWAEAVADESIGGAEVVAKLAEANKLADPYIIYIGQILTVPAK